MKSLDVRSPGKPEIPSLGPAISKMRQEPRTTPEDMGSVSVSPGSRVGTIAHSVGGSTAVSVGSKRTPEVAEFSVAVAEPKKLQTGGKKKPEFQKPSSTSRKENLLGTRKAKHISSSQGAEPALQKCRLVLKECPTPNSPAVAKHSPTPQNTPLCYERLNRASIAAMES